MAEIFEVSQINEYLRQRFEADEFLGSLLMAAADLRLNMLVTQNDVVFVL